MPILKAPQRQPYTTSQIFYFHLVFVLCGLVYGPLTVSKGINANHRGRDSLQWPKAVGTMTQSDVILLPSLRYTREDIAATYTYVVNNQRYTGHQVNLSGHFDFDMHYFVWSHPVSSSVDVYYDPQNPRNAVLIPGADEAGNRFYIIAGGIVLACAIIVAFGLPVRFARMRRENAVKSL